MSTYNKEVKEKWSNTKEYKEFSEKTKNYSKEKSDSLINQMDEIMKDFSICMLNNEDPNSINVLNLVKKLQNHITDNYYHCNNDVLLGLGKMYVLDSRFKNNIDKHANGTAQYISDAITLYCRK